MNLEGQEQVHTANRKKFAIIIIIVEILVLVMYGLFVRVQPHNDLEYNQTYYPMYQDVNVMMLIGFGFLMTFIKRHSWSALSYTFFINAIVVQLYILLAGFWHRVFHGWEERIIQIKEVSFTGASYSVASILIAFGAVLGKVGPLELLVMSLFGIIGYTLNETIIYTVVYAFDAGGSTAIHTFGAYFGLATSFILSQKVKPKKEAEGSYTNSTFAMIGTLFLWMFWPSFNAGVFPENGFQRSLIITNTVISLTGSCLSTFIMSALIRDKFSMEDILNATLAGGVAIGAPCGVIINPAISLFVGLLAGVVSTLGFAKLTKCLDGTLGIHDTCGVHNLHGIPGIIGGIISGVIIGGYERGLGIYPGFEQYLDVTHHKRSFTAQGGFQIAATFISLFIGLGFGILAGLVISCFYKFTNEEFYEDKIYFEIPSEDITEAIDATQTHIPNNNSNVRNNKLPPLKVVEQPSEILLN